jgi:hypothetical protein
MPCNKWVAARPHTKKNDECTLIERLGFAHAELSSVSKNRATNAIRNKGYESVEKTELDIMPGAIHARLHTAGGKALIVGNRGSLHIRQQGCGR